ncbi:unnamed protein product [Psylliodes chrysocephalus]|uniref:Uncharacterized protein n=1 Tax=Psylliodes chrysocephalus TaxID=3402493 RepID=A0A9P0GGV7_9CUCU|nr:unnamed protein product [Psylliodes chrysocephala]
MARSGDKLKAIGNSTILAFNFDPEAVLTTPKGSAGQIFYLRKLAVYNLTVYNIENQDGICYLWDETQGKKDSNEIASCIYEHVLSNAEVKEIRMMTDGCSVRCPLFTNLIFEFATPLKRLVYDPKKNIEPI